MLHIIRMKEQIKYKLYTVVSVHLQPVGGGGG